MLFWTLFVSLMIFLSGSPSGMALESSCPTRRSWILSLSPPVTAAMVATTIQYPSLPANADTTEYATSAGRGPNCVTQSDPSRTVVTCPPRLIGSDGRLASIASTENGVSTSAIRNPSAYASPWSYLSETSDATKAWNSLVAVVSDMPSARVVTVTDTYLHAVFGDGGDDVEFVLRPDDRLVLFRSASRTSVFVYPLTRPVSDRQSNRLRMEQIRSTLGWAEFN